MRSGSSIGSTNGPGPASGPGPDQGGRAAAVAQRGTGPGGPKGPRYGQAEVDELLRRRRSDRAPVPEAGRSGYTLLRDGGLRLAHGPPGHRARARLHGPGPDPHRQPGLVPRGATVMRARHAFGRRREVMEPPEEPRTVPAEPT